MAYAIIKDGRAVEIVGPFTDSNDVQHSSSVLHLWSEQELAEIGVVRIIDQSVPRGKVITGSSLNVYGDAVHREFVLEDEDLTRIRLRVKSNIDAEAEQERQKHTTPGAGQSMAYQAKVDEAFEWINSGGTGYYPMLEAELGITADNMDDLTQLIILMHSRWQQVGAGIERARLLAKKQVDEAQTYDDIMAVTPEWPQVEV